MLHKYSLTKNKLKETDWKNVHDKLKDILDFNITTMHERKNIEQKNGR